MKLRLPFTVLILFVGTLLASCGNSKDIGDADAGEKAREIPFSSIGKGALFGGGQEGFDEVKTTLHVMRSQEEWETFKAQLNSVNTVTGAFKDQELDFESEMIIACIDRVRGSGGHEIIVDAIVENDTELQVNVRHVGPADMAASVLTQPFHIVRIVKSDKGIRLNPVE